MIQTEAGQVECHQKLMEHFGIDDYSPEFCKLSGTFKDFVFRAIPGIFLYSLLIETFVLPFYDVRQMFIFFFIFGIYNLYIAFHSAYFSGIHIHNQEIAEKIDFKHKYQEKRELLLSKGIPEDSLIHFEDVIHYCLIPNYKEQIENLEEMLQCIANQQIAKNQIIIVLAFEEREGRNKIDAKFEALLQKFSQNFLDFIFTIHPSIIQGELAGKSSNEAWAAKQIFDDVEKRKYRKENVMISIFDADSLIQPKHFDFVTSSFANDLNRGMKIYQAGMANLKNYWSTPGVSRVITTAVTLHEMACLGDKSDIHVPFSTYSYPLTLVQQVGGWDSDVIAEDWHMYIKCFFKTNGQAEVVAIPCHVACYAVEGDGIIDSFRKRYTQALRHSWGIVEISYFLQRWFLSYFGSKEQISNRPDLFRTCILFFKLAGIFTFSGLGFWIIFWPSAWTFLCTYAPFIMPKQALDAILGFWGITYQILAALALLCFIVAVFRVIKLLKDINQDKPTWKSYAKFLFDFVVWSTFTQLFFSGYPTFVCATRLFFTDKFVYVVAAKPQGWQ